MHTAHYHKTLRDWRVCSPPPHPPPSYSNFSSVREVNDISHLPFGVVQRFLLAVVKMWFMLYRLLSNAQGGSRFNDGDL